MVLSCPINFSNFSNIKRTHRTCSFFEYPNLTTIRHKSNCNKAMEIIEIVIPIDYALQTSLWQGHCEAWSPNSIKVAASWMIFTAPLASQAFKKSPILETEILEETSKTSPSHVGMTWYPKRHASIFLAVAMGNGDCIAKLSHRTCGWRLHSQLVTSIFFSTSFFPEISWVRPLDRSQPVWPKVELPPCWIDQYPEHNYFYLHNEYLHYNHYIELRYVYRFSSWWSCWSTKLLQVD